jgi:dolichol-phosphate mannosyltransferase
MLKKISYIFPIYNEEGNISLLYETMNKITKKLVKKYSIEFIFINDGSRDRSLDLLQDLVNKDKRVKVINFARNFGHQLAVTAGLDYSSGDAVIIMDSDMQDPPEVSLELIQKWEEGFEVVYAQRRTRKDSFLKKLTASVYYRILERLADIKIPKDTGDFRLMDRKVVNVLNTFREKDRFLRGMVSYLGFKQTPLLFDRHERHSGNTGYSLKKMMKLAKDGIFSFSSFPIRFMMNCSVFLGVLSIVSLICIFLGKIYHQDWFTNNYVFVNLTIIMVFSAIQLFFLALLGEYIYRIYTESQGRPLYIISQIYDKSKN